MNDGKKGNMGSVKSIYLGRPVYNQYIFLFEKKVSIQFQFECK